MIVHCSDTPDNENLSAIDIHKMHLSFGWDGIGYHKVILRNGDLQSGRPEYWEGAHTFGYNNKSLGVCLIGKKNFKKIQFITLGNLIDSWMIKYPNANIIGHKEVTSSDKTCPNFDVKNWYRKWKTTLKEK